MWDRERGREGGIAHAVPAQKHDYGSLPPRLPPRLPIDMEVNKMKQWLGHFFQQQLPSGIRYILSWRWVKQFLYWLIISAGTIAECAFLIASLWMSINSSVHPMVLTMMTERQSVQLSYIATTIYTALPELILSLALVTTINHCRNIRREKQYWYTWVWAALFGLPTVVFLYISIMTVACSVLKVNYI